jgi:hypothetical protein
MATAYGVAADDELLDAIAAAQEAMGVLIEIAPSGKGRDHALARNENERDLSLPPVQSAYPSEPLRRWSQKLARAAGDERYARCQDSRPPCKSPICQKRASSFASHNPQVGITAANRARRRAHCRERAQVARIEPTGEKR